MSISVGAQGCAETTVTEQNTALAMGSGLLPVFATPAMAALLEKAAVNACQSGLEKGQGTVGTHLDISHDAASPVGMAIRAEAEVTAVDGRAITLSVRAFDEVGQIGGGTHQRFIIDNERFLSKAQKRGAK